jgi:hypothetical protein
VQNGMGNHWRWRLLLLLALLSLFAAAVWQAPWWNIEIVPVGGPSIVVASRVRDRLTVMAIDRTTGRHQELVVFSGKQSVSSLRVVRHGTAVAWMDGRTVQLVDIGTPGQAKQLPIPDNIKWSSLGGVSANERFAIFQQIARVDVPRPGKRSKPEYRHMLIVVDLTSGQIVSSEPWPGSIESTGNPDEFRFARMDSNSADTNEARVVASWKLTAEGQWETSEPQAAWHQPVDRYGRIRIAVSPNGDQRLLVQNESASPTEAEIPGRMLAVSPAGYILVQGFRVGPILVGHLDSATLHPTDLTTAYSDAVFLEDDLAALVNLGDDVEIVNLKSAKTIAAFPFGTHRKQSLAAIAIALVVLAAISACVAAWERSSWWMFDAAMATAIIPLPPLIWFAANFSPWRTLGTLEPWLCCLAFVAGTLGGASVLAGWYWTSGRGRTMVRWIAGGLWLCLLSTYLSEQVLNRQLAVEGAVLPGMDVVWAMCQTGSVVAAGVVAIVLLMVRGLGWSAGDAYCEEPSNRFSLASMFVAMVGISALIALASVWPVDASLNTCVVFLLPILSALAIANLIVSLTLSRSVWIAVAQVAAIVVLLPIFWFTGRASLSVFFWLPPLADWILVAFLLGLCVPIEIISGLARCHGWRWMRATQAYGSLHEVKTVRERTVEAPHGVIA